MNDSSEPMWADLRGRAAIVTGGGTGIGRAIALGLARCGAAVAVGYNRSKAEAQEVEREIRDSGGNAISVRADVTDEEQVARLTETACEKFGRLDILVANAGGPVGTGRTANLTEQQWDAGLDLNCKSVFLCVKHAMPRLSDGTGRIIVTGSISGQSGSTPEGIAYGAAKAAIVNMVRCWAKDLAPRGITVNAIAPGVIWTPIYERAALPPEEFQKLLDRIPLGHEGRPEDCVGTVLLLASDDGSYITGQTIHINGGMLMP